MYQFRNKIPERYTRAGVGSKIFVKLGNKTAFSSVIYVLSQGKGSTQVMRVSRHLACSGKAVAPRGLR